MQEITAYHCSDGTLHTDEDAARAHEDALLGMELDGLLRHIFAVEGVTRMAEHRALLGALKKKKELLTACRAIARIIEHSEV